jgi:1-acyl-sn-glycerol-3-phosphate acyltransferase
VGALGWQNVPGLAALARRVFRGPARAFAEQMLGFDEIASREGLDEAARATARLHLRDVRVYGSENLPSGGFLALSNHPGLTDTLALFAALGRQDIRAIALDRPFLRSLPHVSRHLFFLPEQVNDRVIMIREVARYLRRGGSAVTFPAGRNEPDPDAYPGAVEALGGWVDSATVFARLAPDIAIVPVCVRGVTWPAVARHPIAKLRRKSDDRQLLASFIQLLWQLVFKVQVVTARVQIGKPIRSDRLPAHGGSDLHAAVLQQMRKLIELPPQGSGSSAL